MPSLTPESAEARVVTDVIIVGAGFSGCHALYEMRRQGHTAKILEAGTGFGGVWRSNKYPGVRTDSETPLYQLSISRAYEGFNFSERFPHGSEICRYFDHLSEALDLRKDAIFNAAVSRAEYDEKSKTWTLTTETGLTASCRHVIFATGTSNKVHIPDFPNRNAFEGPLIHPSRWPDNLDVEGKRIGVIGQGASGLQIVQELAKKNCELTVFIRNPCIAIPMRQRSLSIEESEQLKNCHDGLWRTAKYESESGFVYNKPASFYDHGPEERRATYAKYWSRGGYAFFSSSYRETPVSEEANATMYAFWAATVRSRISDPGKRDIMAPLEQFQWMGSRRPSLETDYYEMIDRPNVKLVDLKRTSIRAFSGAGIVTDDGAVHELDVIVAATGYDAVTGSLHGMNIRGRDGVLLQDRWRKNIQTYLGMMAPGLPNAFFLYGPQAPTSLANGPPLIELQVEWVAGVLKRARDEGVDSFEPSAEAASRWRARSAQAFEALLCSETPSWWNGANIPGKRREPLIWFGGMRAWWSESVKALKDERWNNFVISPESRAS